MNEKMRGLEEYRAKVDSGEIDRPKPSHNLITRAAKNPNSLAMVINAFCFHCMGGTANVLPDPGWKDLIRTCTAPDCPLFAHRPYRDGSANGTGDDESDEI